MEEFILVAPNGEIYRKETNALMNYRHGDIAREYMHNRNLEIKKVKITEKNGYPWGVELAQYHSVFAIQDGDSVGVIYIPSKLTDKQKIWIKQFILNELELMDGQLFICNFVGEDMIRYFYYDSNIIEQLTICLKEKGVDLSLKEEQNNGIQK